MNLKLYFVEEKDVCGGCEKCNHEAVCGYTVIMKRRMSLFTKQYPLHDFEMFIICKKYQPKKAGL